jgi:hypothetical protein
MSSMNTRMAIYAGAKVIHTDSRELQRFLEARDRGAPAAELRELKMAAQMPPAMAREIDGRNSAARSHRGRGDRGVSTLAEAQAFVRALQLERARELARSAMNEDELRAALRLRDRALGHDSE